MDPDKIRELAEQELGPDEFRESFVNTVLKGALDESEARILLEVFKRENIDKMVKSIKDVKELFAYKPAAK